MNNKDKILVGQFSAPVGLKGEIKVNFMIRNYNEPYINRFSIIHE